MIDKELLKILACPEDHQSLAEAGPELLAEINAAIRAKSLKNLGGEEVSEAIDGGLLREDGKRLYVIRGEIPVLLVDEGIALPLGS